MQNYDRDDKKRAEVALLSLWSLLKRKILEFKATNIKSDLLTMDR